MQGILLLSEQTIVCLCTHNAGILIHLLYAHKVNCGEKIKGAVCKLVDKTGIATTFKILQSMVSPLLEVAS